MTNSHESLTSHTTVPHADSSADADIRQLLWERLPRWTQPLITELTGKAHPEQPLPLHWTWRSRLSLTVAVLVGSSASSIAILYAHPAFWVLLPVMWVLTTSAAQALQTNFVHYASHSALSGNKRIDRLLGEWLSTVIWIRPLSRYAPDHRKHHGKLATTEDADLRAVARFGFRPGLSKNAYWRLLRRLVVSPSFHWKFIASRMRANFIRAPIGRRFAAIAYTGMLFAAATLTDTLAALVVAWLIPLVLLLNVSLLLQLLTEHPWVRIGDGVNAVRTVIGRLTSGRFVGEPPPAPGLPLLPGGLAWLRWLLHMLLVHVPQRLFVVPGDLPNHDWHHRNPGARLDWPNAAYARRDDVLNRSTEWPEYTEHWGLRAWLNVTFSALSSLPSSAKLGEPSTYGEGDM